ncbi:MAG: flagellar hook-basal body complex protein FliE [Roseinatronobacter sp.]
MTPISGIAIQNYDRARPATAPDPTSRPEAAFGAALGDFAAGLRQGEVAATETMLSGADPHALVHAMAQAELAVETAVAVRDKVVEAYLEIIRMPI